MARANWIAQCFAAVVATIKLVTHGKVDSSRTIDFADTDDRGMSRGVTIAPRDRCRFSLEVRLSEVTEIRLLAQ